MPKTDSFGIRVPVRDVATILYYYYHEIGSHGLSIGGCLRDVISRAAETIRESHPEIDLDEDQAAAIVSQLKNGISPSKKNLNFGLPRPASLVSSTIDPAVLAEAAREISKEEEPKERLQFEADIIDD